VRAVVPTDDGSVGGELASPHGLLVLLLSVLLGVL
jgi:hypothetical protein